MESILFFNKLAKNRFPQKKRKCWQVWLQWLLSIISYALLICSFHIVPEPCLGPWVTSWLFRAKLNLGIFYWFFASLYFLDLICCHQGSWLMSESPIIAIWTAVIQPRNYAQYLAVVAWESDSLLGSCLPVYRIIRASSPWGWRREQYMEPVACVSSAQTGLSLLVLF